MQGINCLEERGRFENVLEGLGEPVFDKEVLNSSFYSDCVNFFGFVINENLLHLVAKKMLNKM